MQAIILAAGRGTRLAPIHSNVPKCLFSFQGIPILKRMVDALVSIKVREILLICGYKKAQIGYYGQDHIMPHYPDLSLRYIENTRFESTNTGYSLSLALDQVTDPFLVLDGDVVFQPEVLQCIGEPQPLPTLLCIEKKCGAEEMKVRLDSSDRLIQIGKGIPTEQARGEFVGIAAYPCAFAQRWQHKLAHVSHQAYYEEALQDLIEEGASFQIKWIRAHEAMEIDTPEDARIASELF
jgi:choline kinase